MEKAWSTTPGFNLAVIGALLGLVSGCSTVSSYTLKGNAVNLDGVPFYAQDEYQCGPAALATVLGASDVAVSPEALVDQVYIAERRGSLQPEMKAAVRGYDRLPHVLAPDAESLFAEVAAGRPVLVMQNLLIPSVPRWHYAVVVGFSPADNQVILRSGMRRERRESLRRFLRSWGYADNWAVVVLRPGELPAVATPREYIQTLIEAEGLISAVALATATDAGVGRWPRQPDLQFVAANLARANGAVALAIERYLAAIAVQPNHPGALNNLADLLLQEGCTQAAKRTIDKALQINTSPQVRKVIEQTAAEVDRAASADDPATMASCEALPAGI